MIQERKNSLWENLEHVTKTNKALLNTESISGPTLTQELVTKALCSTAQGWNGEKWDYERKWKSRLETQETGLLCVNLRLKTGSAGTSWETELLRLIICLLFPEQHWTLVCLFFSHIQRIFPLYCNFSYKSGSSTHVPRSCDINLLFTCQDSVFCIWEMCAWSVPRPSITGEM